MVGGDVRVWDAATGREKMVLPGVTAVAFLPDGRTLTTAAGATVSLLDTSTGERTELPALPAPVRSLTLAPGGRWLAAECEGGQATLLDLTGASPPRSGPCRGRPAFAPDGRTAAMFEGNSVTLWQLATQQEVLTLDSPGWHLLSVAFSRDGQSLVGLGISPRDEYYDAVIWPASFEKVAPGD